ncbi:MAG TPA: AtpZ/AtpI family protein [Candidatus Binatia bacterium]|jgi:F0F1-type ATP synthase assembly protein I|nr:AtpZ/AtpI family protein [Candidatus Binatia bacterium]
MPKPIKDDLDRQYALLAFKVTSEFGAAIAAPVVILTLIGKRLDAAYGTGPAFLIAGFAFSVLLSAVYVYKRTKALNREYQALDRESRERKEEKEQRTRH